MSVFTLFHVSLDFEPLGSVDRCRFLSQFSPAMHASSAQLLPTLHQKPSKSIDHPPWLKAVIISIGKREAFK